uniref:C2H2-type domain-containing protein n=2 Tax=Timema TaxID=61471 RepID=A0A7R9AXC1_TIMSH|nr:unnamed protein product [Timema shepardi]CAD7572521.1 unnamed protein product [Timema californicum]
MENGSDCVCCPVCTLYMREGVTLQSHLDTHPKDQVIAALVKVSKGREHTSCGELSTLSPSSIPLNQAQITGEANNLFTSPSSNHYTTAITYQQFLNSNTCQGGPMIPQYVSVPTFLAASDSSHRSLDKPGIVQMVYNPFLLQPQLGSVVSPTQQHFLSPFLPPAPSLIPTSPPQQGNITTATTLAQTTLSSTPPSTSISHSASLSLPVCQVSSSTLAHSTSVSNSPLKVLPHLHVNETRLPLSTVMSNSSYCSDLQDMSSECCVESTQNSIIQNKIHIQDQRTFENAASTSRNFAQDRLVCSHEETLCMSKVEIPECFDMLNKRVGQTEGCSELRIETGETVEDNDVEALSPSLEVKNDLNLSTEIENCIGEDDTESLAEEQEIEEIYPSNGNISERRERLQIVSITRRSSRCIQVPVSGEEFITSDSRSSFDSSKHDSSRDGKFENIPYDLKEMKVDLLTNTGEPASSNTVLTLESPGTVNIIEIDGIHILVPSEFLDNTGKMLKGKESSGSLTALTTISPHQMIEDVEVEVTTAASLDIQADETMPPKGELSEQESVGGNDSSLWVQAVRNEDEDVSASYDLLARESWEASDGSDGEGNMDIISTVNTVTQQTGNINENIKEGGKPHKNKSTLSKQQTQRKSKVLRSYMCWTCGNSFNCPKERRVHQAACHPGEGASGHSRALPKKPSAGKRKTRSSKVKEETNEERKLCIEADHTNFEQVVVKTDNDPGMLKEDVNISQEVQMCVVDEGGAEFPVEIELESIEEQNKIESELIESQDGKRLCNKCHQVLPSDKALKNHIASAHIRRSNSKYTCMTCKEDLGSESQLTLHYRVHPLECSHCGKYFYRRQNMSLHIRRHLGIKPYKCTVCDKGFITRQKLLEHSNSHTGNAPLKCPMCDETFRRYSNLIQHKNKYHLKLKKKVKDFICHCGEIFHSKKKLVWHQEIHSEKPKSCMYCSERFVHEASLTRHIRRAHDQSYISKNTRETENIECPTCGGMFLKTSLAVHLRVHAGLRPFSCPICGKDFTTRWNLQLHRWTHASRSSKPFKCTLCKSAFIRRSDYVSHINSHRNVRPYTCNFCGAQFIRKYNCIRHVREHETNKSYACSICHKTFHRSYYLKEHLRVHSGARPFACHICGKASTTKSNHNKHIKIHHAREPVNTEG